MSYTLCGIYNGNETEKPGNLVLYFLSLLFKGNQFNSGFDVIYQFTFTETEMMLSGPKNWIVNRNIQYGDDDLLNLVGQS